MSHKIIISTALAVGMMLTSCTKEDGTVDPNVNSNGQVTMTYQMRAVNPRGNVNQKSTAIGLLQWTSGFANPRQIKFEAKMDDLKIEFTSNNKSRIDLFAPTPVHFGSLTIPAGTYDEIELKVKLEGDGPDPALFLAGTYNNSGLVIPVEFRVEEDLEIKTEQKDVTIDSVSNVSAVTNLDLAIMLNGVTDAKIQNAKLTNGILVISRNSNRSLYETMLHNISGKRHKCDFKHDD